MTIPSNPPASLSAILCERMQSSEVGESVRLTMATTILKNFHGMQIVNPFAIMDQSDLEDNDIREEKYLDQSRYRTLQRPVFLKIGELISKRYFNTGDTIVELGAGIPDTETKQTLFESMLPRKFNVVPSDINQKIVDHSIKVNPKYHHVDSRDLKNVRANHFVACNLIDTLTPKQLKETLDSLQSLPTGGCFVHMSDISPMINAFAWDLITQNDLVFPNFEGRGDFKGAIIIRDYANLRPYLNLSAMELDFLDQIKGYSPQVREQTFHHLLSEFSDHLTLWIKKVIPETHLQFVSIVDHFENKLKSLSVPKMKTVFCGAMEEYAIIDKKEAGDLGEFNSFSNLLGTAQKANLYCLAADKVMIKCRLLFFVMQKI